jgi:hypothetical protein
MGRPPCAKLASLGLADCPKIGDDALRHLGRGGKGHGGCSGLKFFSCARDDLVTDKVSHDSVSHKDLVASQRE